MEKGSVAVNDTFSFSMIKSLEASYLCGLSLRPVAVWLADLQQLTVLMDKDR